MDNEGPRGDTLDALCALLRREGAAPPANLEGRVVFDAAVAHGVQYLAVARLIESAALDRWFDTEARSVVAAYRAQMIVDDERTRELGRVLAALSRAGVAPIVFKGAALAHTHYEQSFLRVRTDADILFPTETRAAVTEVMCALGYQQPPVISGELAMRQAPFERTDAAGIVHAVDAHWHLANPELIARALTHADLAARAVPVAPLGPAARCACAVDALLIACLHRAAHHQDSEQLLWLYDIHVIAGRLSGDEWRRFLALAARGRVNALCARGLSLARVRFHTAVPALVLDSLADAVRRDDEPSAVYLRKDLTLVDQLAADARALGWRDTVRLAREHLFPPATYMAQRYGVRSRALLPALYARRILSGARKWFRPLS